MQTWYTYGPGTYNSDYADQAGKANNSSWANSAIAVSAGAHLEIYSGKGLTGSKVIDVVGPKLIQNPSGMSGNGENGPYFPYFDKDNRWLNYDFSQLGPMMAQFTPSTRENRSISSVMLNNRYNGSFKLTCPGSDPAPTPAPAESCTDECGEERNDGAIWCTAGINLSLGQKTSQCVNGNTTYPSTVSGMGCDASPSPQCR